MNAYDSTKLSNLKSGKSEKPHNNREREEKYNKPSSSQSGPEKKKQGPHQRLFAPLPYSPISGNIKTFSSAQFTWVLLFSHSHLLLSLSLASIAFHSPSPLKHPLRYRPSHLSSSAPPSAATRD